MLKHARFAMIGAAIVGMAGQSVLGQSAMTIPVAA